MGTLVKLETSMGDITLEMLEDDAPITTANYLAYVNDGFYDGLIFHRVIAGFMVQGGGMDQDMNEKQTNAQIQNEADNGVTNKPYTVAMARTNEPHSASSQFFINVADNTFLNHLSKTSQGWGYTVFAKVTEGTDVVDNIKGVKTGASAHHDDVPQEPVVIVRASVVEA